MARRRASTAPLRARAALALLLLVQLFRRAKVARSPERFMKRHTPREEWLRHGEEIRSPGPFRDNIEAILDLARERGERVALLTFALYVPEDYSPAAFASRALDYGAHGVPVELWGERRNVERSVAAHNEVIRSLSAERDDVLFVDAAASIAKTGRHFDDACHLSVEGSAELARSVVEALAPTP